MNEKSPYDPSSWRDSRTLGRLAIVGLTAAVVVALFAHAAGAFKPNAVTQTRFIDGFEKPNGVHAGFRRNHSKGLCVSGYFEATGAGTRLSRAAVFAGRSPVTGRFALANGNPTAADNDATVRSMALRFRMVDGEEWRTGMNAMPVFVARTPEEFYGLTLATAPDPQTGQPDPARVKPFLESHPEVAQALEQVKALASHKGFADSTYNSLNAFRFVDANGQATAVRWAMVARPPGAPAAAAPDTDGETPAKSKDYLFSDLAARIAAAPVQWDLVVTLGQHEDSTKDSTIAWPESREKVTVGRLTLNHAEAEGPGNCRDVNFDPLVLPHGIEGSDDPQLSARSAAYALSHRRRSGETKTPSEVQISAVSPTGAPAP